jgi:malonyl CoA-acyl carrier protein transacylase
MEAVMFPGQGSQKRGMGAELFDSAEYRAQEPEITQILGYSLKTMCCEDPDQQLNQTQYTQPALYVVNHLSLRRRLDQGQQPNYLVGHSLGEINALQAAGAFSFVDGLRIVQKRGELMAEAKNGAMAALIGPSCADILDLLFSTAEKEIDIANLNSPTQTVVSGSEAAISGLEKATRDLPGCMFFRLPVSAAFHSRHMRKAASIFYEFLEAFTFDELRTPVISNVTARPYPTGTPSETLRWALSEQMYRPVRWVDTVKYLAESGVTKFTEVGPGNVLTRLTGQITEPA